MEDCTKLFKATHYLYKHFHTKHPNIITEDIKLRLERAEYFANFILDPSQ